MINDRLRNNLSGDGSGDCTQDKGIHPKNDVWSVKQNCIGNRLQSPRCRERLMRQKLLAIFIVLAAFTLSTSVLARNTTGANTKIAIVFISQISSDGQKAAARERITKNHIAAAQHLLQENPAFTSRLRSHGVQLRNVVDFDRGFDGSFIFYIR
jgi:hypothetical protein